MKIAVISDIHGNYEALCAVLKDIDSKNISSVFSLGDNIGYGPDPDKVVKTLISREIPSVLGNHEYAVVDPEQVSWFNDEARISILRSIEMMSAESIGHVGSLPRYLLQNKCRFVHGFPPDSPTIYLFQVSHAKLTDTLSLSEEWITFTGHTHFPELIIYDGSGVEKGRLSERLFQLDKKSKYIINTGSVGQPRDGDLKAKYVVFDTTENTIALFAVDYDREAVAQRIISLGLPACHANRLLYTRFMDRW